MEQYGWGNVPNYNQRQFNEFEEYKNTRDIIRDAKLAKAEILEDKDILRKSAYLKRSEYVSSLPQFKKLIQLLRIVKEYDNKHVGYFQTIIYISLILFFVSFLILPMTSIPFFIFALGILVALLFYPKIRYRSFFNEYYKPILLLIANVDEDNEISFKKGDFSNNTDETIDEISTINKIQCMLNGNELQIQKQSMVNNITHYSVQNEKLYITKKMTTIFSGYIFDYILKSSLKNDKRELLYAVINDDTYYKTSGLTDFEFNYMTQEKPQFSELRDGWQLFINENYITHRSFSRKIQKKVLKLQHELGIFNLYVYNDKMRLMFRSNKNREEINLYSLTPVVKDENNYNINTFFSTAKTYYICNFLQKIALMSNSGMHKVIKPIKVEDKKESEDKKRDKKKTAEMYMDTAMKMLLSVILSALVFSFIIGLLSDVYVPGVSNLYNNTYKANTEKTIQYDDYNEEDGNIYEIKLKGDV